MPGRRVKSSGARRPASSCRDCSRLPKSGFSGGNRPLTSLTISSSSPAGCSRKACDVRVISRRNFGLGSRSRAPRQAVKDDCCSTSSNSSSKRCARSAPSPRRNWLRNCSVSAARVPCLPRVSLNRLRVSTRSSLRVARRGAAVGCARCRPMYATRRARSLRPMRRKSWNASRIGVASDSMRNRMRVCSSSRPARRKRVSVSLR